VTGAAYLLTQVITLVSYVVLARLAGPKVFGTFAAAWILLGVSSLFVESGMSAALIQRKDRMHEAAATAVVATFAAGVGLTVLAGALSPLVGLYFHSREIGLLAAALSGVLFLNAATVVPDALMRRRFSFLRSGVIDPIYALTYGVVGAAALAAGMGVWGLVLATYVSGVIRVAGVWIFNRWLPDLHAVSFGMWRELVRYARHIVASEFLREISGIINTALLGRFLGLAPLGAYRFGWRIAIQVAAPVGTASNYVLLPAFARISDDAERFRAAFLRSLRLFAVLVLPISLFLPPLGEQVGVALLGERWRAAGQVLAALAGVTLGLPLITLAIEVFKAANRPNLVPRVSLLLTLGTILLIVAFLPLGIAAVAGGVSLAYVLVTVYALRNVARVLELPPRLILAELWRPALAACTMAGTLALFAAFVAQVDHESTLVRLAWLAAEIVLGLLVYGSVLLVLARSIVVELIQTLRRLVGRTPEPDVPAPGLAHVEAVERP
jgi:PST family polysaccharide transporter